MTFNELCKVAGCNSEERAVLAEYLALLRYKATMNLLKSKP